MMTNRKVNTAVSIATTAVVVGVTEVSKTSKTRGKVGADLKKGKEYADGFYLLHSCF